VPGPWGALLVMLAAMLACALLGLVIEQAVAWGATALDVSWVPGFGSPEAFYVRNGFVPTGAMDGEEIAARLTLASTSPPSAPSSPASAAP
jgi:hypothetical protein